MGMTGSPVKLCKGTIESVPLRVTDSLENLTTFSGKDLRFDLKKDDAAETPVITNASCAFDVLTALPLINTTTLDEGYYNIFLSFVNGSETPRLGPFRILIDD